MLRRDNIFHPRDRKKQYSKKKGKKKESNHLVTRTGLAPLRNFVIPFRFDHDHGEKKRIPCYIPSMKFTDRRDLIDPSFISLFLYILSNSFPSLVLFSSSSFLLFFRNRSRTIGKKEKDTRILDDWKGMRNEEREREAILLFYYLFYEVHRRRGRFREFIFNPCCRLLSIRYSDNFCFEKPW